MGSDDEGPLQAFKKGDDRKVQPNSWMGMLPKSPCPMWGILIRHAPSWHAPTASWLAIPVMHVELTCSCWWGGS